MPSKKSNTEEDSSISRRKLISKYGAYTAPTVIALLSPAQAYSHVDRSITYSTSIACAADPAGGSMHQIGSGLMGHCMIANSGGGETHMIINPTIP